MTVSRDCGQGIPQGRRSALCWPISTMRRFILGWQRWSASRRLDARIVNYADDLVILCRRGTADEAPCSDAEC